MVSSLVDVPKGMWYNPLERGVPVVNTVSNRVVRKFMSAFVEHARRYGAGYTSLNHPDFSALRARRDFRPVMEYLKARGLLKITPSYSGEPARYSLTDAGLRFFEDSKLSASELRWTRGLALASLIVAIVALCISGLSLCLQFLSLSR